MPSDIRHDLRQLGAILDEHVTSIHLDEVTGGSEHDDGRPHDLLFTIPLESTMPEGPFSPARRPRALAVFAIAAAIIAVVALVATSGRDDGTTPSGTTVSSTTVRATTNSTESTSDAAIADGGLVATLETGAGYAAGRGQTFGLDADIAAKTSACQPYLDTVFESVRRPSTVRTRSFGTEDSQFEQYIAVFPERSAADAMMASLREPSFGQCFAPFVAATLDSLDCCEQSQGEITQVPNIRAIGDDLVAFGLHGSTQLTNGDTFVNDAAVVFMRVGRAVVMINPPLSTTYAGRPGFPIGQLESVLSAVVGRLTLLQS